MGNRVNTSWGVSIGTGPTIREAANNGMGGEARIGT